MLFGFGDRILEGAIVCLSSWMRVTSDYLR